MWKKRMLCLVLIACAFLLAACGQQQESFPNQPRQETETQQQPVQEQPVQQQAEVTPVNYDDGSYDPASEEGGGAEPVADSVLPAPTIYSDYAGATPVKIDPVDKPTPTPLPKLTFAYTTYQAPSLRLTFEGPAGWIEDATATDRYTLTNPDPSMDYAAQIVIQTSPLSKDLTQKELTREVKGLLDTIRSDGNYDMFEASNTATRTFISGNGVYASFKGYLNNLEQTGVAGRVIVNSVNKILYVMTVTYPRGLADTFAEGVYNKVRSTMKLAE